MSWLLPRLDRQDALEIIERHAGADVHELSGSMPLEPPRVTYSPGGGSRLEPSAPEWTELRGSIVELARQHGMPGPIGERSVFEGRCARLLRDRLSVSPHEAAHEEVWSYLTCCWLMDVARWRWGSDADVRRFIGDLNRNTFRRLWWRAETLGDFDLTQLGEDELVAIMERPTLASDTRLARAMVDAFVGRVAGSENEAGRMMLMREASKRMLRLTPFIDLGALDDDELRAVVLETFERAAAAVEDREPAIVEHASSAAPGPSPSVTPIERLVVARSDGPDGERVTSAASSPPDFDSVAEIALDLARRTGNVTNMKLRELTNITSDEARDVFRHLVDKGVLVRRGAKRGTHYVLADVPSNAAVATEAESTASPARPERPAAGGRPESALGRLLRRRR